MACLQVTVWYLRQNDSSSEQQQ